jgi:hypothetical protein
MATLIQMRVRQKEEARSQNKQTGNRIEEQPSHQNLMLRFVGRRRAIVGGPGRTADPDRLLQRKRC